MIKLLGVITFMLILAILGLIANDHFNVITNADVLSAIESAPNWFKEMVSWIQGGIADVKAII